MTKLYKHKAVRNRRTYEHVLVAERALGRPLPKGAVVHHIDGNGHNNSPNNLVICPSQEYHGLLHIRQRAMDVCGNPNWLKCTRCLKYDDPNNLKIVGKAKRVYHLACELSYANKRYRENPEAVLAYQRKRREAGYIVPSRRKGAPAHAAD